MDASTFQNNRLWKPRKPLNLQDLKEVIRILANIYKKHPWKNRRRHKNLAQYLLLSYTNLPCNKEVKTPILVATIINA